MQSDAATVDDTIAKDVGRTWQRLTSTGVYLLVYFQKSVEDLLEYCTTYDLDVFNKYQVPDQGVDFATYFERLVLCKIASKANGAFSSYQQGYCEIANVVMQQTFQKFTFEHNTNL